MPKITTSNNIPNWVYDTTSSGSHNISISSPIGPLTASIDEDLIKFLELVLAALGQNITFDEFKNMSDSEKNQLLRDIKLKTIL
jgi:hypothetical protein